MTDQPDPATYTSTIKAEAVSPKQGMTLVELEAFLAQCTAAGIKPITRPKIVVGFRGQIKRIEATW